MNKKGKDRYRKERRLLRAQPGPTHTTEWFVRGFMGYQEDYRKIQTQTLAGLWQSVLDRVVKENE